MPTRPPLFVWRVWLRLRADVIDPARIPDLEARVHAYETTAGTDGNDLLVTMRVVGHVGPASAVGDAAQILRHHAAGVGLHAHIEVVHAERVSATGDGKVHRPVASAREGFGVPIRERVLGAVTNVSFLGIVVTLILAASS